MISFAEAHPELVDEWAEPDITCTPQNMSYGARRRITWICKNGHRWEARVKARSRGSGCPFCVKRRVVPGQNDLKTLYPELAREWNYDTNRELGPKDVSFMSTRFVSWKGECGHVWKDQVCNRVAGAGCTVCEKAFRQALPAAAIRYYAEKEDIKYTESDDTIIGIPIQFYLPDYDAAIEISGRSNYRSQKRQIETCKNWLCLNAGIRMIRILSPAVQEFDNCICITRCEDSNDVLSEAVEIAFKAGGVKIDVNVERDLAIIKNHLRN